MPSADVLRFHQVGSNDSKATNSELEAAKQQLVSQQLTLSSQQAELDQLETEREEASQAWLALNQVKPPFTM